MTLAAPAVSAAPNNLPSNANLVVTTKTVAQKIKSLGLTGSVLLVTDTLDDNVFLSSRNLPDVLVLETREVDPVSLVHFENVLLTRGAVTQFEEMLG